MALIISVYFILLIPMLYLTGWLYWFVKHKKPSKNMPRIISFHKISDSPELGGTFNTTKQFENFIKFLRKNKYESVNIYKMLTKPDKKNVLIFFDDAYESIYSHAFPIMKKYGYTGVLCPVVNYIGKNNTWDRGINRFKHMNEEQIKEMSENGFEIISHSMNHRDLRKLKKTELLKEINESKKQLEKIIGKRVEYFIYPFGLYNDNIKGKVMKAGYRGAFSSHNERNDIIDFFAIGRNTMYIIDTNFDLKVILDREPLFLFGHEDQKGRIINWFSRFSIVIKI